jgi:hypothetical protein
MQSKTLKLETQNSLLRTLYTVLLTQNSLAIPLMVAGGFE